MTSEELYNIAYYAQHTQRNLEAARASYAQLLREHPDSKEAGYAQAQLSALEALSGAPVDSQHVVSHDRATGEPPKTDLKRNLLIGLAFFAIALGLFKPMLSFAVAAICAGVAYLLNKRGVGDKATGVVVASGILLGASGFVGLKIENHYEEEAAQEKRVEAQKVNREKEAVAKVQADEKAAVEKTTRIQGLDTIELRVEAAIATNTAQFQSEPIENAQLILDQFVTVLSQDVALAKEQSRSELATSLQALMLKGKQSFGEARKAGIVRMSTNADELYSAKNFSKAQAQYGNAASELEMLASYANGTPSIQDWARGQLQDAKAKTSKAIQGQWLVEASEYFQGWRAKKRNFEKQIQEMGSESAHKEIVAELVKAGVYLRAIEEMTPDEAQLVAKKFRSKSFIKATRKDLKKLENKAQTELAYVVLCGPTPQFLSGGGNFEAEQLIKKHAHDPDSVDVENCTKPVLTMRECWRFQCDVRAKNGFGAKRLTHKVFYKSMIGMEFK